MNINIHSTVPRENRIEQNRKRIEQKKTTTKKIIITLSYLISHFNRLLRINQLQNQDSCVSCINRNRSISRISSLKEDIYLSKYISISTTTNTMITRSLSLVCLLGIGIGIEQEYYHLHHQLSSQNQDNNGTHTHTHFRLLSLYLCVFVTLLLYIILILIRFGFYNIYTFLFSKTRFLSNLILFFSQFGTVGILLEY